MTPPCHVVQSGHNVGGGYGWGVRKIESQAPLREWTRVPDTQEFEYKTDCQRAIAKDCYREVEADGTSSLEGSLCYADCIAADDPRLKRK